MYLEGTLLQGSFDMQVGGWCLGPQGRHTLFCKLLVLLFWGHMDDTQEFIHDLLNWD